MTSNSYKKILCTTVSALALVTAFAPPALAFTPMSMASVAMSGASRDNTNPVVEAAYRRVNQLIESASPSHLSAAEKDITRGVHTSATQALLYSNSANYQKYAVKCQKEVNPGNSISAQQVTKLIRQDFLNCMHQKEILDVASAQPQSYSSSLNSSFLAQCQSDSGVKPGKNLSHNFSLAQKTYDCVARKNQEQYQANALKTLGLLVGGAGLLVGGAAYYDHKLRQKPKHPS